MSVTFPFCQIQISSRLAEFQLRQIGHTSKQFHSSHSSICFKKKSTPLSTTAHSTAFRTLHQPTASVISSISWVHGCCWGRGNCPRAHNLFWSEVRRSAAGVKLVRQPLFCGHWSARMSRLAAAGSWSSWRIFIFNSLSFVYLVLRFFFFTFWCVMFYSCSSQNDQTICFSQKEEEGKNKLFF